LYEPAYRQVYEGKAQIKMAIRVPKVGLIAGSQVIEGKISRGSVAKVMRGRDLLIETRVEGLKRFKDDVREVPEGLECGIHLADFDAFEEGDVIESYVLEQE